MTPYSLRATFRLTHVPPCVSATCDSRNRPRVTCVRPGETFAANRMDFCCHNLGRYKAVLFEGYVVHLAPARVLASECGREYSMPNFAVDRLNALCSGQIFQFVTKVYSHAWKGARADAAFLH